MKKMMSLLLSGMMVLSLAACSGSETAKESTKEEPKTEAKETAAKESEAATRSDALQQQNRVSRS